MTYRPCKKNFKAPFLSGMCAVFAVSSFYISSLVDAYMIIYQLFGIITATVALQIFLKYVQCNYVYKAGEKELEIYKITGNKSVCVCSLAYEESISTVIKNSEYEKNKKEYPKTQILINYSKNIFPKDFSFYFFNFNGKKAVLKFEPDDIFTNYVNEKINAARIRMENEENDNE